MARYDREHTFFFCDPPYLGTNLEFSSDHVVVFGEEEHKKLAELLKGIKGKFLLTINNHELIRELYKEFTIEEAAVQYSVSKSESGRGKYGKLLIRNY